METLMTAVDSPTDVGLVVKGGRTN